MNRVRIVCFPLLLAFGCAARQQQAYPPVTLLLAPVSFIQDGDRPLVRHVPEFDGQSIDQGAITTAWLRRRSLAGVTIPLKASQRATIQMAKPLNPESAAALLVSLLSEGALPPTKGRTLLVSLAVVRRTDDSIKIEQSVMGCLVLIAIAGCIAGKGCSPGGTGVSTELLHFSLIVYDGDTLMVEKVFNDLGSAGDLRAVLEKNRLAQFYSDSLAQVPLEWFKG